MRQRNRALHIKLLLGLGVLLAALSGCGSRAAVTATGAEETASPANAAAGSVNILLRGDSAKIEGRGAEVEKGVLVIHEGGTYRLTGESRLPIEVRAANVSVTLIFAGEETNSIETDGREKKDGSAADPEGVDAAIFAKGNLTLRGSGSANIKAANRGIVAKGELIVAEGIFDLRTEDDIFCGKESVTLQGGAVRASTQGDKGKGVSSDGAVTLSGGSYVFAHTSEGIEGKTIEMRGGSFDISADDDGMNAREHYDKEKTKTKKKEANPEVRIHIAGGKLYVTAGGDGIDSNGDLIFSGGMSFVNGSDNGKDAALDWNGSCRVDGGVLIASGMKARAEKISPESAQPFFEWKLGSEHPAREQISVQRGDGSMLYWELPRSACDYVQISCPELTEENTLHAVAGNESIALR